MTKKNKYLKEEVVLIGPVQQYKKCANSLCNTHEEAVDFRDSITLEENQKVKIRRRKGNKFDVVLYQRV